MQDVQKVLEALNIGRIDFKSDQDEDVRKHTHNRKIDMELVKATSAQEEVLEQLRDVIRPILKKAVSTGTLGQASLMMSRFMEGSQQGDPRGVYRTNGAKRKQGQWGEPRAKKLGIQQPVHGVLHREDRRAAHQVLLPAERHGLHGAKRPQGVRRLAIQRQ